MFTKSRNKHVAKISCNYIKVFGQAKTKKENGKNRKVEIEKVLTLNAKCHFLRLASPCVSVFQTCCLEVLVDYRYPSIFQC